MKNSFSSGHIVRWTLLTMIGLAAGIVTGLSLGRPIETIVGMMLVTPIVTLLAGSILGASQWLQLRTLVVHSWLWILATCIGLGVGLALGVIVVEQTGWLLLGHRPRIIQFGIPARALSFAVVGVISGLSVGVIQWILVLRRRLGAWKWLATSATSLGVGFSLSSLIVDGILGGLVTPVGVVSFVLLSGLIFGLGTARPLLSSKGIAKNSV